jgi:phage regulator Rha-like protein
MENFVKLFEELKTDLMSSPQRGNESKRALEGLLREATSTLAKAFASFEYRTPVRVRIVEYARFNH